MTTPTIEQTIEKTVERTVKQAVNENVSLTVRDIVDKAVSKVLEEYKDPEKLIRAKHACELLGIGKSSFYKLVQHGIIPEGTKISASVVLWKSSQIQAFVKEPFKLVLGELE